MKRPWDITRRVLGPVLTPFYRAGINRRNKAFDDGVGVVNVPRPVISIGNITTGGTGKSPTTQWVCRRLLKLGARPAVALRGYKPDATGQSDEASEHARLLPGVPVIVGADRAAAINAFLATQDGREVSHIVLDDGFQHRQLARQLDIVLVDASRNIRAERLLPAGDLREPLEGLMRAGVMVITRGESLSPTDLKDYIGVIRSLAPRAIVVHATHTWTGFRLRAPGASVDQELTLGQNPLAGKRVLCVCALANPSGFVGMVERSAVGGSVRVLTFPDHDPYLEPTLETILGAARDCEVIVTTEKDWSKLSRVKPDRWPGAVARPKLEMVITAGEQDLDAKLAAIVS
jgi:tetraacyldisaccharide 4'-kinase